MVKCSSYTISVSTDVKYNAWSEVIDPCNDIMKGLWNQYKMIEGGRFVCTKDSFYTNKY